MSETEWLAGLKEGDPVVLQIGGPARERIQNATVSRATRARLTIDGFQFERKTGRQIGGSRWWPHYITKPTPELVAEADLQMRRLRALGTIERTKLTALPLDALERIAAIIREHRGKVEAVR